MRHLKTVLVSLLAFVVIATFTFSVTSCGNKATERLLLLGIKSTVHHYGLKGAEKHPTKFRLAALVIERNLILIEDSTIDANEVLNLVIQHIGDISMDDPSLQ